jgi:DNA polymerase elongation subunit (family B)
MDLVISKRLSRELTQYRSLQANVVAALLGAAEEGDSSYIYADSGAKNPYQRVKPSFMVDGCGKYDKKKYAELTRRTVMSLLSPFVNECEMTSPNLMTSHLENYIRV